MPIIVKANADFENHPEGQALAVCVDVVDLGQVENKKWGKVQQKVAIVFHSQEKTKDGKPFEIWERFTASLDEKAHLRKFLQGWRGKAFTQDELLSFDLEKLIGVGAFIQVVHNTSGDKTYANIGSIMLPPKGTVKMAITQGYERRKDRKPEVSHAPEPVPVGADQGEAYEDDGMPF
jgi:hypothetical protein